MSHDPNAACPDVRLAAECWRDNRAVNGDDCGSTAAASEHFWIGLDGWVLQDGNYTDFEVGECRRFALEYRTERGLRVATDPAEPGYTPTDRRRCYSVSATVVRTPPNKARQQPIVLDFGLLAYNDLTALDDLEPPSIGARLTGELYLSVDPFMYMDRFAALQDMPGMTYSWTIREILLDQTPRIPVAYGHPLYVGPDEGPTMVSDPEQDVWVHVDRTRMWEDNGSYRLRCTLHHQEPTRGMPPGSKRPHGPVGR